MSEIHILFSTIFIIKSFNCIPIEYYEPIPEIQALQNPELFGGDMMGIDKEGPMENFNAIDDSNKLWPLGTIAFVIDGSLAAQRSLIMTAMDQYHQNTCIRFVERTDEYDYLHISQQNGCYSFVGRAGGKQLLSLGIGCYSIGTIVHELGHAVGFFHEHQRSDRDNFIDIFKENIKPNLNDQFDIITSGKLLVSFDFNSIMLYGPLTFSKDEKSITMAPNKNHSNETMREVHQKYGLSQLDIIAIQKLYQC